MNKYQKSRKVTELTEEIDRLRCELRRMQVNCDRVARVRAIELPEPANEEEAQLVADMAQRIMRALE